jgi:phage replication O-like protein O
MSSPQLENGYIKIANDIYDAFCRTRISGEERQILDCILRKTYGWNKCEDAISISQFADMTGIQKPHIIRAIKGLLAKNIISIANIGNGIAKNGNDKTKVYKFIKDYAAWRPLPKKATLPKMAIGVAKNGNPSLPKMVPTKDTTTKDTIQKTKTLVVYSNDFLSFWSEYPKAVKKKMAFKEWEKNKTRPDIEIILKAIREQKKNKTELKCAGQFCPEWPDPERWIKNERWNDELLEIKQGCNGNKSDKTEVWEK